MGRAAAALKIVAEQDALLHRALQNDGGPAIPNIYARDGKPLPGMSLRAYLEGQALARMAHNQIDSEKAAAWAVEVADALLAELQVDYWPGMV